MIAASSVFAGISGYVDAKYQINFDNGDFGYTKPQDKLKASIKFDDHIGKKTGEGKVYIDAAASFSWNSKEKNSDEDGKRFAIDELGYFKLSLDKLMIVGQNWTLNLKEAEKLGGYAISSLDSHTFFRHDHLKTKLAILPIEEWGGSTFDGKDKLTRNDGDWGYIDSSALVEGTVYNGAEVNDRVVKVTAKDDFKDYQKKIGYSITYPYAYYLDEDEDTGMHGITFQYKGYKLALALNGHVGDKGNSQRAHNYYMAVETKDFNPVDGLTLKAAVGASYRDNAWKNGFGATAYKLDPDNSAPWKNNTWLVAGSFKANYKADKFNIDFATDHALETNPSQQAFNTRDEAKYYGATMVKAQIAPVNVQIFFSNEASAVAFDDSTYSLIIDFDKHHDGYKKEKKYYFTSQGLYKKNVVRDLFSAELGFDLGKVIEKVPVSVRVQGLNMLSNYFIFNAFVDVKLADGKLKLQVYGKDLFTNFDDKNWTYSNRKNEDTRSLGDYYYWDENGSSQKIGIDATYNMNDAITLKGGVFMTAGNTKIGGNVGATYKADLFTVDGSLATELDYFSDWDTHAPLMKNSKHMNQGKMQAKASITSDKLVNGAILSLTYESGNILGTGNDYDWFLGQQAGKLTAKCRVNF